MSVRNAMLALIATKPEGVYRLKQTFEEHVGGTWTLNIGQVYQTMQRLERDGFVDSHRETHGGRESEVFTLTEVGQSALDAWLAKPVARDTADRDELVIKLAVAVDNPDADVPGMIQRQRKATSKALREYVHAKDAAEENGDPYNLVVDRQIFQLRAELRWLDAVESKLAASGDAQKKED
ncbi:MAG: PadR family transcriptional regulator [Actinomyces sp.]|jgi:DNA-binding PadR family transcriptional regulator|nr:PadR family transcriptional regulator [Actinomyces sp.]MCI1642396.1 PadR family transcriptional regulator [Actinomyces sp.]MCI1662946.1 PadR family transcriptional regulator [Actinomyces sp.]MCI1691540.1 PadR family transcriptional regulator [Actinomyces sp.]MCI1787166.1 PadR family transcriptional regulator [Actinomyces sp.]MCI1829560.1 PadR family transcriptional regulator [Actinomyces sp.]